MNQFVIAEAEKCIGCRTCEIACAVAHAGGNSAKLRPTHFFPRLKVIKSASVSVPVLCHQCENAPCASVCPQDALVRDRGSVQVIQSRCIGCKSCVIACPFGAINVVLRESNQDDEPPYTAPSSEVHKCDLCVDVADSPSCVRVCPTSALRLVTSAELQQRILEKQRRSARGHGDVRLL
ncbi:MULTISPECIES: 4Fe-4S dicluster domain-containing protein [unclassified Brenneria]|uniref:4Fe-4S dicluster domain-containing protein n=1 Tax=unclassified Brenneria TaxID=2634434 RepID=UPI001551DA98|nr:MULTISPECIES: 4Fe-4S dicluster domain-containing protein [unclassified Brenneria]MBJ7222232.1 4Fe-4S dicluster domain-containing protein [Brenneria sp. L3-3C-1]MEE3643475.1 4Fe-4S dicluster domain-containing protein [Brenneria sp. L3_3C_1]MEE3651659.1 4Fe-4S dicluster domain-containing protein [Brenneria sp. HEZEL_4_2_4]NPD01616.1 4Fe-4S dicluster domain-containing protein [Brenneria sp. hezel4-2-4]